MRIAVLQAQAVLGDVDTNVAVIAASAEQASARGATVLVTPELFCTGYLPQDVHNWDGAPIRAALASVAQQYGIAVAASTVERQGAQSFITATLFDSDGAALLHYRKAHLFGVESRYFTQGDVISPTVELGGLRVALAVCFDVEFPEYIRAIAARDTDVLLVPTAVPTATGRYDATLVPRLLVPARAIENNIAIAYANHGGTGFAAHSCIVGPLGRPTVYARTAHEIVYADVTAEELRAARDTLPYLDSRRLELY